MELETINKLFLELSQVATAVTSRELTLKTMLAEANQLLRSAMSIVKRRGNDTNWTSYESQLSKALAEQHRVLYPDHRYKKDEELRPLATKIARGIMKVGNEPGRPATRIQFKSGQWPDETDNGGLCENSLVNTIAAILANLPDTDTKRETMSSEKRLT